MNYIYFIILVIFLFYLLNLYEHFVSCKIITCSSGYTLSNNTCVNNITCPSGQYVDSKNICVKCSSVKSDTTIFDSSCKITKCDPGYYLNKFNNTCKITCDIGYSNNITTNMCDKNIVCDTNYVNINNICTLFYDDYNFTNCGATGRFGPNFEQCKTSYTNTNLKDKITMETNKQGIQIWKVPKTGKYLITVAGAGIYINNISFNKYSKGAVISSIFILNEGEVLKILVGQQGTLAYNKITDHVNTKNYSGCGGSFVVKFDNTKTLDIDKNIPLIIAGGAGGSSDDSIMIDYTNIQLEKLNASFDNNGKSGITQIELDGGGKNGNGGSYSTSYVNNNTNITSNISGNSGGGFYTDGKSIYYNTKIITFDSIYYYGSSFLNGGNGGLIDPVYGGLGNGGFGGGGSSMYNRCGSGGGYSGGGFTSYRIGFGGGSYSSENMNVLGYNDGMGYVNIKYLDVV